MSEKTESGIDVGKRLRSMREERKISMRALARMSGLSANALSMIERGLTSPSVSTLTKLADALEVPITSFFREEPDKRDIVYCNEESRRVILFHKGRWEGLGGETFAGRMEAFMLILEPGGISGTHGLVHTGHEFVLCLEGVLEYKVRDEHFTLKPGDSLIFASNMVHQWRNASNGVTKAVILISGFDQDENPSAFHLASGASSGEVSQFLPQE